MASNTARILSFTARKNRAVVSKLTGFTIRPHAAIIPGHVSSIGFLDNFTKRWNSSYPSHEVVGMPSLSPVSFLSAW